MTFVIPTTHGENSGVFRGLLRRAPGGNGPHSDVVLRGSELAHLVGDARLVRFVFSMGTPVIIDIYEYWDIGISTIGKPLRKMVI